MSDIFIPQNGLEDDYEFVDGKYSDLPRSNMPLAKDDIDEMQDLSQELVELKDEFYSYIEEGDLASAADLIENHPEFDACVFNADKFNSLRDPIIALQRLFLDDIENYIMNLSEPQGEWDYNTEYKKYQVVSFIWDDATQYYAARQMIVPAKSEVYPEDTSPLNDYYWTPVTLRGKQGFPGTGLTPAGKWTSNVNYYNYEEDNVQHVSMVLYDNIFWQATTNNINSQPTFDIDDGIFTSSNPDWTIMMALNQAADTILMPYGETIADVINGFDNRSKIDFENLLGGDGYAYTAEKISNSPVVWEEKSYNEFGEVYATKTSTKVDDGEWNISFSCPETSEDFTLVYEKDENGRWSGRKYFN